jgi:hypothetical protein
MVGGGGLMLICFVLPWTSISIGGISDSGDGPFNYFFTGGIAWLLVVAVGVLALLKVLEKLPATQPWHLIFLGGAGLGALLMILRVLLGGRSEFGVDFDRGFGMYVAAIAAIATAAGAFMNFQAEGGELSDLTDMDKLKGSFAASDKPDNSTPPPPPPPPPPAS